MARTRRTLAALLSAAALTASALAAVPAAQADTGTTSDASAVHYYVALGDSLSVGYQPAHDGLPAGDGDHGYVDDVYAALHAKDPSLQLVKLGCSGETTGTMINGGKCAYAEGSQLAAAVAFLSAHKGEVSYLTLDIGANDVDGCAPGGSIDAACVLQGLGLITKNLLTILDQVRAADGGLPLSVGMTYYDPFLQYWTSGFLGSIVATASVGLLAAINAVEGAEFLAHGFKTADVFDAFDTANFTRSLGSKYPKNVQTICDLTWMCSQHNIHANDAGYQVIADAFLARMS